MCFESPSRSIFSLVHATVFLGPRNSDSPRRQWHPTPVLLPGKSRGQRNLVGCSPWGWEESDMTEQLHFHFSLLSIGEGNGTPLQCSCLENPRDGVTQSQTRLKWLSSSSLPRTPQAGLYSCLCHLLRLLLWLAWIIIVVCSQSPVSLPPSLPFPPPLYCHLSTFWAQAAPHFPGECKTFDGSPWPTRKFRWPWHLSFPIWDRPVWPE